MMPPSPGRDIHPPLAGQNTHLAETFNTGLLRQYSIDRDISPFFLPGKSHYRRTEEKTSYEGVLALLVYERYSPHIWTNQAFQHPHFYRRRGAGGCKFVTILNNLIYIDPFL